MDGAVRNAALQRGLAPLANPVEMGLLLENLAAGHLHALSMQSQVRLFHWRDGSNEVDFVYDDPRSPVAFEIGSSPDHSRRGLQALRARYQKFENGCYVVAPGAPAIPPSRSESGIGSLPLDLFLIAVGRQAESGLIKRLGG